MCRSPTKPPRLVKRHVNCDKTIQSMLNEMNACDISSNMNNDLSSDPNMNYDILHNHISNMKEKHLPFKFEKYHKHKHKNNKWISFGIIRSIKTRDAMYWSLNDAINIMSNTTHWKITFVFSTVFWIKPFVRRKYNTMINYSPNTKAISRRHGKLYQILFVNRTRK